MDRGGRRHDPRRRAARVAEDGPHDRPQGSRPPDRAARAVPRRARGGSGRARGGTLTARGGARRLSEVRRHRALIRVALIYLAVTIGFVAAWILIAPKGFY